MKIDIRHILSLPENERDDEIRKLISEYFPKILPKPWKHEKSKRVWSSRCVKCGETAKDSNDYNETPGPNFYFDTPCPIPDRIALDANLAFKMFRKQFESNPVGLQRAMLDVWVSWEVKHKTVNDINFWLFYAQPRHYILAAVMAMENKG